MRGGHGAGRQRLLQRRRGAGLRGHGHSTGHPQDANLPGNAKRGLFTVADFIYDAENDRYTCPAEEHLTKGKVRSNRRDNIDHYRNLAACLTCALKPRCTPDKVKRLKRWEHEGVLLSKTQARLDHMPEAMTIRRQTVEHPFGTLKAWMEAAPTS